MYLQLFRSEFPFILNVISSVSLIFLNRYLLQVCEFGFVGLLSALHMTVTALVANTQSGVINRALLSRTEVAFYALATDVSMISMNLSLKRNSVGVYQLFKLLMIPTTAMFQYFAQNIRVSRVESGGMAVVVVGVLFTTATDYRTSTTGLAFSSLGLLSSAAHNVATSTFTVKYETSASSLVAQTAPLQAATLFFIGPIFDVVFTKSHVQEIVLFRDDVKCSAIILVTCALAAVVNISLVWCIKRYDATGANILGHVKTVCVLFIGWVEQRVKNAQFLAKQIFGACIVVAGIYIWSNGRETRLRSSSNVEVSELNSRVEDRSETAANEQKRNSVGPPVELDGQSPP